MKSRTLGNVVGTLVLPLIGFVFAFLVFFASMKVFQLGYELQEAAIATRGDLAESEQLMITGIAVQAAIGLPFVIALFVSNLMNKRREVSKNGRRVMTIVASVIFVLMMLFLFEPLTNFDFMYPVMPYRELAYGALISLAKTFACIPVGIVVLISLIVLIVSLIRKK